MAHAPGINRGSDYLLHSQRLLRQTAMQLQFDPIQNDQRVGSLTMDMLPVRMNAMGSSVNQRIYATRVGAYVLLIAVTFVNDDELQMLMAILDAMQPV